MNRRYALFLSVFIAAGCASSALPGAKIPRPTVHIVPRTNLAAIVPSVPTGIAVHYEFRITNNAQVPITLKRIDLDAMPGGGFQVEAKTRPFDLTIAPGETRSADFVTTAFINDPMSYESRAPVAIRAQLLFDSPEGKLQTAVQQRVNMTSGD